MLVLKPKVALLIATIIHARGDLSVYGRKCLTPGPATSLHKFRHPNEYQLHTGKGSHRFRNRMVKRQKEQLLAR